MCILSRKRNKEKAESYGYKVKSSDHEKNSGNSVEVKGINTSATGDLTTPSGTGKNPGNENTSRSHYKSHAGNFLKSYVEQDIEYKEDGTTDLIGGWAKHRKRSLDPMLSISPFETPTKTTPSRSAQRNMEGMSPGEQIVMVLNLQAKIANLNSTLTAKDNQLQEKEAYWDRLMVEERDRTYQAEEKLRKEIDDKTSNLRESIKGLKEKFSVATAELEKLKVVRKRGENTNTAADSAAGASDEDSDKEEQDNKRGSSRSGSPINRDDMDDKNSDIESEKDKRSEKGSDNEDTDTDKKIISRRKTGMIVSDSDDENTNDNETMEIDEKTEKPNVGDSSEFKEDEVVKNYQDIQDKPLEDEEGNDGEHIEDQKSHVEDEKAKDFSEGENQTTKETENKSDGDIADEDNIQLGKNKSKNNIYSDSEENSDEEN